MNVDLKPLLWPASRLGEALASLARESGLEVSMPAGQNLETLQWTADWMEAAAASLGLEAQPAETAYSDFDARLPTWVRLYSTCLQNLDSLRCFPAREP